MVQCIGNRLLVAAASDVGRVRTLNEDAFLVDDRIGLLIVADGMGGHDAGEIASRLVVESIRATLRTFPSAIPGPTCPLPSRPTSSDEVLTPDAPTTRRLQDEPTVDDAPNPILSAVQSAINRANAAVNGANVSRGYPDGMGMGSTLVGLWLPEYSDQPVIFHVGDSRLYLFRHGQLFLKTQDHSMYQQWLNFGSHGHPPAQNILLQAIGPSNFVAPDVIFQDIRPGDIILLCSDGLSGMIPHARIVHILSETRENNLEQSCQKLINLANKAGGKDNITVILGYFL
ncbi:MAG: serine/threonine-protein phosphatase [Magnetococcales bacterium]|nr:serine/threonine-protein phosphatase [Magnetococcales bacterium]NGZ07503.1 serine/threonine-protein phosphatase [Magnetococcales bacterium]